MFPVFMDASTPTLSTALENLTTCATSGLTMIQGNEMLYTLWAASLTFLGFGIVKAAKKAAKK